MDEEKTKAENEREPEWNDCGDMLDTPMEKTAHDNVKISCN